MSQIVRNVSVGDPVKQVSDHPYIPGLTASYHSYLIHSVFIENDGSERHVEVWRRFSDFVSLAEVLSENKRGYIIFPRPGKGSLEVLNQLKSEEERIEFRRLDLERYLQKLCEHPVISQSDEMRVFLTASGPLLSSFEWHQVQPAGCQSILESLVRLPGQLLGSESSAPVMPDVSKSASRSHDILRMMKEFSEKVKQEYQHGPIEIPEEEEKLRETRFRVERYSDSLVEASKKSEKVIREMERLTNITGDVGLSLLRLARYEDERGEPVGHYSSFASCTKMMASDARSIGMSSGKVGRLERVSTEELVVSLDPINNQLALAPAVINALKEREEAMITLKCIENALQTKKNSLESVNTLHPSASTGAQEQLKNEIAALESANHSAKAVYTQVRSRNIEDLERWRMERTNGFKKMLEDFGTWKNCFESIHSEWFTAKEDLKAQPSIQKRAL